MDNTAQSFGEQSVNNRAPAHIRELMRQGEVEAERFWNDPEDERFRPPECWAREQ